MEYLKKYGPPATASVLGAAVADALTSGRSLLLRVPLILGAAIGGLIVGHKAGLVKMG